MELVQENLNQYVLSIPIAFIVLVIGGAILVFTFGFKSAEQPPFDKLTNEDRKLAGKKRKYKEKKSPVSGTVSSGELKNEKDSKKSSGKEQRDDKQENKEKKSDNKQPEKNKKNEVVKLKSNEDTRSKKIKKVSEKPLDFDDGNWETIPTKLDKKKKGDHSPDKKEKKLKKAEKEPEKVAENVANEESNSIEIKVDQTVAEPTEVDVEINVVEEKLERENKKEKKPKKEIFQKPLDETEKEKVLVNVPDVSPVETINEISGIESISNSNETAPVFDELGDVWTETKVTKKTSKKKARRDN